MSFTGQDVIDKAAKISSGLTIDPADGLKWVNDAVAQLLGKRTDANFDENGELQEVAALVTAVSIIPLDARFLAPLAHYVAAQAYFSDSESAKHQSQAIEQLKLSGLGGV